MLAHFFKKGSGFLLGLTLKKKGQKDAKRFLVTLERVTIAQWIDVKLIQGICVQVSKVAAVFLPNALFDLFNFCGINFLLFRQLPQAFHPQKLDGLERELLVFYEQILHPKLIQLPQVCIQLRRGFGELMVFLSELLKVFKFGLHDSSV